MTEIYIDKADLNMYQLKTAPPKWDLQEYIVTYLKEKDNRYLAWFLHYYEKTLNNNVQEYMRKLFMPEHFADMKQAYIAGLLKALKTTILSKARRLPRSLNEVNDAPCLIS